MANLTTTHWQLSSSFLVDLTVIVVFQNQMIGIHLLEFKDMIGYEIQLGRF